VCTGACYCVMEHELCDGDCYYVMENVTVQWRMLLCNGAYCCVI